MRRPSVHVASDTPDMCEEVDPGHLESWVTRDAGAHRDAAPWCLQMHDWDPCHCGYRVRGSFPAGTWHYANECV